MEVLVIVFVGFLFFFFPIILICLVLNLIRSVNESSEKMRDEMRTFFKAVMMREMEPDSFRKPGFGKNDFEKISSGENSYRLNADPSLNPPPRFENRSSTFSPTPEIKEPSGPNSFQDARQSANDANVSASPTLDSGPSFGSSEDFQTRNSQILGHGFSVSGPERNESRTVGNSPSAVNSSSSFSSKSSYSSVPSSSGTFSGGASGSAKQTAHSAELNRGWNWFWYGREEIHEEDNAEFLMASNWLIRFGMLILVLGIGFFVKYSIDKNWLSPEIRIAGTTVLGVFMYLIGLRIWRTSMNLLGQALVAGSACILYFSAYGATRFCDLIPEAGLAWSCAVTVLLIFSSLRWDSRLVAVFGILGAYLTPLLFPQLRENILILALYLLFPAIGILIIRRRRSWGIPAWIAFVSTGAFWVYPLFYDKSIPNTESEFLRWTILGATFIFLGLFHLIAQRRVRLLTSPSTTADLALAFLSAVFFSVLLQHYLKIWDSGILLFGIQNTSVSQLALGLVSLGYFGLLLLLKRAEINQPFRAMNCALAFVVLLLTAGSSLGDWNLPVILIICTALHSATQKIPSNAATWLVRLAAIPTAFLSFWAYCNFYSVPPVVSSAWLTLMPERILRFSIPGICLLFMAASAQKAKKNVAIHESSLAAQIFSMGAIFYLFIWVSLETWQTMEFFFPQMQQGALSIVWSVFALSMLLPGIYCDIKALRNGAHCLFALIVAKIFLRDISNLQTFYRISAFVLLGILLLAGGVIYLHNLKESKESKEKEIPKD